MVYVCSICVNLSMFSLAGKFAAIAAKMDILAALSPFKPPVPLSQSFKFGNFPSTHLVYQSVVGMALAEPQWNSPETKEPSPKFQKLFHHLNGADLAPAKTIPLLKVKKLTDKATLPSRASARSAGYDLASATETNVPARGKALIPTDLSIGIPEGTYGRIAPRSGLAWKHSIDVGAGVIDGDYRGPVGVILFNHSDTDFEVKVGDRIAQLILEKISMAGVSEVEDLDATERGDGGFGSTGV